MRLGPITFVVIMVVGFGCNSEVADDTPVEATREQRIDNLANEACGRYEACNGYGTDKQYASAEVCKQEYKTKASEAWPIAKCADNQFDNSNYAICVDSVKQVACTGDIWDGITAVGTCTAEAVCTDGPA